MMSTPAVGYASDYDSTARIEELTGSIRELGSVVVAFSGGVDSSVVAALAYRALGSSALAVTAVSPALASGELDGAHHVAQSIGIKHHVVTTRELEREEYRRNATDRCYHCKTELYEQLEPVARSHGYAVVLSGANADDLGDWRPGLRAADEHGVGHPLLERGVRKEEVRVLASALRLPSAHKPASPCLASRLPYGTRVTTETLRQVDRAERALHDLGYKVLRVRHFGDLGVVELPADDLPRMQGNAEHRAILDAVRGAGYAQARVSQTPFQTGSLNLSVTAV